MMASALLGYMGTGAVGLSQLALRAAMASPEKQRRVIGSQLHDGTNSPFPLGRLILKTGLKMGNTT